MSEPSGPEAVRQRSALSSFEGRRPARRSPRRGCARSSRTHRSRSGATRVRPHRLRHTYGTELASAGIDLLALRELMGHASAGDTAAYVHLSPEVLARQYAAARQVPES